MVVVALVAVAGAGWVVAADERPPLLSARAELARAATFPGPVPALDLSAQGESAVEVDGFGTLGTAGPSYPLPIASVAKVMTAYVVLRDHPLASDGTGGLAVTITAADVADQAARVAEGQSTLAVAVGETLTEQQLLEGLLLPSGNNVAGILADVDAGSEAAFVTKMNDEARALGMTSTTYTDPSGFTATTASTATDQLRLAVAAMAIPAFAQIVGLSQVTLPVAGVVKNYNTLVGTDGFVGIKTGSDARAGGCLVFADERTVAGVGVRIIGVILGQDAGSVDTPVILGAATTAAQHLADSAATSLAVRPVLAAGTPVASVTNPDGRTVTVTTTSALSMLGYGGEEVPLQVTFDRVGRRLHTGQPVATVRLAAPAGPDGTTTAVARADMPGISWSWRFRHVI